MLRRKVMLGTLAAFLVFQPVVNITIQKVDESDAAVAQPAERNSGEVTKLALFYMTQDSRLWPELAEYQARATVKAARKHKLKLSLLAGLITTESEGYPFAKSVTGAAGLGQIDYNAHKDRFPQIVLEHDKYDPMKNIDCAADILKEHIDKYGLQGGLQVYNLGEGSYRSGKRSAKYVAKVFKSQNEYKKFGI